MTRDDQPNPAHLEAKTSKGRWWKRVLKVTFYLILLVLLTAASVIGLLVQKYHRIVGARPGGLQTGVQPKELGRWVNPFVGTGGFPWVCGNNFPGATVPFGLIRLGPETVSMVIGKRALNTSGYYYGDERVLGFSHTRLIGTRGN